MLDEILGNRYKILREIGSGGMAKVYLAEDMNEGQLVAVKVLYPHLGEDFSYIQRFAREAKLAGSLNTPHIVRLLDYGSSRDTHYLVMEFVEGRDLRDVLNERGPLPWNEALTIIDQVCIALEEANAHDIIHRDIKPQNIMITDDGIVKVLDFGIARSRVLPSLTQSGFVGSPYYISPEQAMGEDVDVRSDIYSTGIVLYELLSGRVPFDAQSPWSIISQHIATDPPEIELDAPDTPLPVQRLLRRMVAKNRDDRYQGPSMLRQAVKAVLDGGDLPTDLGTPPPANMDRVAMADSLYRKAEEAVETQKWQTAVGLLNQVIELHPKHPTASNIRAEAGTQARLHALYTVAKRALEANRWQEAIDELTEIIEIDPDYKDAAKLLAQAREGIAKQSVDLQLSELYDQAVAYFDADEYEQAEVLFAQIRDISPTYRRADALWVESRRRKTKAGGFDRLNEELGNKSTDAKTSWLSKPQFTWLSITALVVLVIIGGVWGVTVSGGRLSQATPSLDERVAEAQSVFEAGDWALADSLVSQILETNPDNEAALQLRVLLDQEAEINQKLIDAAAFMVDKNWTQAIESLEGLRDTPELASTKVDELLCDAYLERGNSRLASVTNPNDQATLRAALADFEDGQQVCSNRNALITQLDLTTKYLDAQGAGSDLNEVIENLQPVVTADSNFAGGQAVKILYQAYLDRGDQHRAAEDIRAAVDDYGAALGLDHDDLTEAQGKHAEAMQALGLIEDPTPDPTAQVNAQTDTQATPTTEITTFKHDALTLLSPEPLSIYEGELAEIILTWEAIELADNEYYDVTIRHFVGEEPAYWGAPLSEPQWRVPIEAGYGKAGRDEFSWWVTIREQGTNEALSPPSEERTFIWKKG